jgi:hypothetical protein
VSEYRSIDPAKANVDLDVISVADYTLIAPNGSTTYALENTTGSMPVTLHLVLSGGLGRITSPDGRTLIVNEVERLSLFSEFPILTPTQRADLNRLLLSWKQQSLPLRFLDFGTHALLLEDKDNLLTIPPGQRELVIGDDIDN